ncbi:MULTISPECIES: NifU family protein [unclassified Haematospirillum]|uniref:NifU family protein n=1 Tax=unclassified Haematospirillum TaxID=2622088 RepID=UPI00143B710F|nr:MULTISPECIES: NifU family protein [unclassified Haematospirillum]NKD55686.1 NifU family protein [Haematospirillum sp. H4890]NKD75211.1 NifU family protein [Haematospirillum sp. H4485]
MFIQTESTPNPDSLKFIPGRIVMASGTADYRQESEAMDSPLATRLFAIEGVAGIFLGADFVTVTRGEGRDWQVLKPLVLGAIMEHFTSGAPVTHDSVEEESFDPADAALVEQIKELIETRVRPVVARDGGDIVFRAFRDGTVYLHMRGSCSGCPSSTMTLKHGIENMLRHFIPEVRAVEAVS